MRSHTHTSATLSCVSVDLQVYAVEYTDMAKHARTLVEKNGFGDVIEVMQGSAESIELPEKVKTMVKRANDVMPRFRLAGAWPESAARDPLRTCVCILIRFLWWRI